MTNGGCLNVRFKKNMVFNGRIKKNKADKIF